MIDALSEIDRDAAAAGERYIAFLRVLNGLEQSALSRPDALMPRAVQRLQADMESVGDDAGTMEEARLRAALDTIVARGYSDAFVQADTGEIEHAEMAEMIVDEGSDFGSEEIDAQIVRDIAQMMRRHRKRGMEAQMHADSNRTSFVAALNEMRVDTALDRAKTWFTDRAGRRIPSQKHIKRLWGQILRDGYLQAFAAGTALTGAHTARIVHPDPGSRAFGHVVYLDGRKPDLAGYADIFHPNARATLVSEQVYKEHYA